MEWVQDSTDSSWSAQASDGTKFVTKELYVDIALWKWAIVWSTQDGFRVGTRTFATADDAKRECEELSLIQ